MDPAGADVLSVAFSPDGEWLVTAANDSPPALWRPAEFAPVRFPAAIRDARHPRPPRGGAGRVQPDGKSIVTAADDGVARIFDAQTHRLTRQIATPGLMQGATFSPDSKRILTYGSDFIGGSGMRGLAGSWRRCAATELDQPRRLQPRRPPGGHRQRRPDHARVGLGRPAG